MSVIKMLIRQEYVDHLDNVNEHYNILFNNLQQSLGPKVIN